VIVTVQFDHSRGKWRYKIELIKHDIEPFVSDYNYTSDTDAHEAGKDAIDFELYRYTFFRQPGKKL